MVPVITAPLEFSFPSEFVFIVAETIVLPHARPVGLITPPALTVTICVVFDTQAT